MNKSSPSDLFCRLNRLYEQYNRREYIHPDPLEFLYQYPEQKDREIVGCIASSLAYGRVQQILQSVSRVLLIMGPSPYMYLMKTPPGEIRRRFQCFVHRFATGEHIYALLIGIKHIITAFGSLYNCFLEGYSASDENLLPALTLFARRFHQTPGIENPGHLIPCPDKKSACKRLNLFLRWMVRQDSVDPGGWQDIAPSRLIVPLDIHLHRISRAMGLTCRNQADLRTALEITEKFRILSPDDPVRFDFVLTRFGIRRDLHLQKWMACLE